MLTTYKRGDIYWVRGTVNGVKVRESTRCRTAKASEAYRARLEKELADPNHAAAHKATVATAAVRFLKELKREGKAAGTINMYECKVGHVVRILGDTRLYHLSRADVLRFIEEREKETAHPHTIHRELTALRRILRSAAGVGEFSRDTKTVLPRYASQYKPRTRWLTENELDAVMSHLEPGRAACLAFAVATAADYSSIFSARVGDIGENKILVRGTKTSTRMRTLPRVRMFAKYIDFVLTHADGVSGNLFAPWVNMTRDIGRACKRAGVDRFTSRDLRRTTGTWLLKAGVPINIAAKYLGHVNTLMLQRIYGQLDFDDIGRAIEAHTIVPVAYLSPANTADIEVTKDGKTKQNAKEQG